MIKSVNRKIATLLALVVTMTLLKPQSQVFAKVSSKPIVVTLSVRSSQNSDFISTLDITSIKITQAIINAKEENLITQAPLVSDTYLTMLQNNQEKTYRIGENGELINELSSNRLVLPEVISAQLLDYAGILRKTHYGKLISWREASPIVPLKSIFTIIDLATGLSFQVQRRAGSDHADVQPLSKQDSAIMKQIYHDSWSWKRTAILVHSNDQWLAASMNGMPHGGDGIPGNDFSGHFCVHFLNSSTHKSPEPDLAHQLMVYKAAGNLKAFFEAASPLILAKSFVEAMNHQDLELFEQATVGLAKEKAEFFKQEMKSIQSIQPEKPKGKKNEQSSNDPSWAESLTAEVALKVVIYKQGDSKKEPTYRFILNRDSKRSPWLISNVTT